MDVWDILNKIAIIVTIMGIPATIYGIFKLIYSIVIKYDAYRELNEAKGYTLCLGEYTYWDKRIGKNRIL